MKSDAQIQHDVMEELNWEPVININEIGVAVKNGVVTLNGMVDTYSKKIAAERAAKRVSGVKAVAQDIEVTLTASGRRNDPEIAETVINTLKWNSQVPSERIKIVVEDGWVTLEGTLEWEYQRVAARNSIENLYGVKGILDNIIISSKVKPVDIKQKIKAALERSAVVDAEKINVEVSGNKVILRGIVHTWTEKADARNAACSAPGVWEVDDKLEIETEVLAC